MVKPSSDTMFAKPITLETSTVPLILVSLMEYHTTFVLLAPDSAPIKNFIPGGDFCAGNTKTFSALELSVRVAVPPTIETASVKDAEPFPTMKTHLSNSPIFCVTVTPSMENLLRSQDQCNSV